MERDPTPISSALRQPFTIRVHTRTYRRHGMFPLIMARFDCNKRMTA